jgi:predicted kinase
MASDDTLRSIKIGADETSGWSSDRPQRATGGGGRPRRPSGRALVLSAGDTLSFPAGGLVVFTGADPVTLHRLVGRLLPRPAVLSHDQLARAVAAKVPAEKVAAITLQLMTKAVSERVAEGKAVVIETTDLTSELRTALAALADRRAGSHLVLLDAGRKAVADEERFEALRAVAAQARSGEIGSEGFSTVVVLGRSDLDKVTEVEFTQRKR